MAKECRVKGGGKESQNETWKEKEGNFINIGVCPEYGLKFPVVYDSITVINFRHSAFQNYLPQPTINIIGPNFIIRQIYFIVFNRIKIQNT
jgi:hypothetical protein